MLIIDDSALL